MPTLYVENVPEELYEALRERARGRGRSIASEVISLLEDNVPTPAELARRRDLLNLARKIRARTPPRSGDFPSAEDMQAEDRKR
jgi:plasmid stability protein